MVLKNSRFNEYDFKNPMFDLEPIKWFKMVIYSKKIIMTCT